MTPEQALNQFETVTGLRVFAVLDRDGTVWWAQPETETPSFECTIGDRYLHVDELANPLSGPQSTEPAVPGGIPYPGPAETRTAGGGR